MKGLIGILESWKNHSESWKSPGYLFLKKGTNPAGLSTGAGSRPKLPASQLSLAGYFHLILPVLLMKILKNTIVEACKASVSQF